LIRKQTLLSFLAQKVAQVFYRQIQFHFKKNQQTKVIHVYIKPHVGSVKRDARHAQYERSVFRTQLAFTVLQATIIFKQVDPIPYLLDRHNALK
jgi:hypothetical protein